MRMPFMEFIGGGDPKFMIALTLLFAVVVVQIIRKRKLKSESAEIASIQKIDRQVGHLTFAMIMLSVVSLLLGFLHSFYFMGEVTSIAPKLMFNGVSRALISPTYGVILYTISRLLVTSSSNKLLPAKS